MNDIRLLRADEIEVKIKQVSEKGAVALLYKTARTDMAILDESFGQANWRNDYKEIKGNLFCGIAVYFSGANEWVWRWDCGIESRSDDEGNEKKGEASDAFKRAGTRWGIGRELYSAPFIFLNVDTKKESTANGKTRYILTDKFAKFDVKEIGYDQNRRINRLVIVDEKENIVYSFPKGNNSSKTSQQSKPITEEEKAAEALKKALERKIVLRGAERTLESLNVETLQALAERAKDASLRDDMLRVMQHKFTKNMQTDDDSDLPF